MTFALSDLVRGLVVLSVHPRQAEVAPGAAKAFGFSIPAGVLSIVDEVIESMTDVRFWLLRHAAMSAVRSLSGA